MQYISHHLAFVNLIYLLEGFDNLFADEFYRLIEEDSSFQFFQAAKETVTIPRHFLSKHPFFREIFAHAFVLLIGAKRAP